MAENNLLVENLEAAEKVESTSAIQSDKIIIMTLNHLTVGHMWFNNKIIDAFTCVDQMSSSIDKNESGFKELIRCALLCNRAEFKEDAANLQKPILQREAIGEASESAILRCCELNYGGVKQYRERNPKICEIPFNSSNKYQVSVHQTDDGDERYLVVMKGAPERILECCSSIYIDGNDVELDEFWKKQFFDSYIDLGSIGERVLGLCDFRLDAKAFPKGFKFDADNCNFQVSNLRFLGLISMINPPTSGLQDEIYKKRCAGIKVIMVTGDHPITAKAIARAVGIISDKSETVEDIAARLNIPVSQVNPQDVTAHVVHGNDLVSMSEQEIEDFLINNTEMVFARTTPMQKLFIAECCQRQGAITAIYGDDVNDFLALIKAP